ncbi:PREDICTED: uncharacterized protein LOC102837687 [Chrysochloris asiatica]|uniref:Uncharacterized protein LOC102837687 n=1 Tax=Chrysochloris asiatica TaxID=185453 RepID=A0A9B0X269_CHRAS|nr:PREDICTED: uncharacterized protein LOC102837687 [Chrysochloris asiatica]
MPIYNAPFVDLALVQCPWASGRGRPHLDANAMVEKPMTWAEVSVPAASWLGSSPQAQESTQKLTAEPLPLGEGDYLPWRGGLSVDQGEPQVGGKEDNIKMGELGTQSGRDPKASGLSSVGTAVLAGGEAHRVLGRGRTVAWSQQETRSRTPWRRLPLCAPLPHPTPALNLASDDPTPGPHYRHLRRLEFLTGAWVHCFPECKSPHGSSLEVHRPPHRAPPGLCIGVPGNSKLIKQKGEASALPPPPDALALNDPPSPR